MSYKEKAHCHLNHSFFEIISPCFQISTFSPQIERHKNKKTKTLQKLVNTSGSFFQHCHQRFYEDLQDLLELTPKKDVLFIIGDWNAKLRSQETPGVTGLGIWPWNTE